MPPKRKHGMSKQVMEQALELLSDIYFREFRLSGIALDSAADGDKLLTNLADIIAALKEAIKQAELETDFNPMALKELHDAGPWMVSPDGGGIQSDDFTHDVILRVTGDFYNDAQRKAYSDNLAAKLNATPSMQSELAPSSIPAGWQLVPIEPTDEMVQAGLKIMNWDANVSDIYEAMLSAAHSE